MTQQHRQPTRLQQTIILNKLRKKLAKANE
jgi:hypothetical protein